MLLRATLYGDADLDGAVAADDLLTVRRNLGASGLGALGQTSDFDYNGRLGSRDLLLLRRNFGAAMPAPVPSASLAAVPEPGAAAALLPLAAIVLRRRRRGILDGRGTGEDGAHG